MSKKSGNEERIIRNLEDPWWQRIRSRLPVLETWVWSLVREDPSCCRATKPVLIPCSLTRAMRSLCITTKSHSRSTQLEKACVQQGKPSTAKKKDTWKYCVVSLAGSYSPKSYLILPCVVITLSLFTSWFSLSPQTATATTKSLQSCPTLCDPIPGILQARTLVQSPIN